MRGKSENREYDQASRLPLFENPGKTQARKSPRSHFKLVLKSPGLEFKLQLVLTSLKFNLQLVPKLPGSEFKLQLVLKPPGSEFQLYLVPPVRLNFLLTS